MSDRDSRLLNSRFGGDFCSFGFLKVLPFPLRRQALRRLRPRWDSSARLETRTKESNKCASHMLNESIRRTEREARFGRVWCHP